MKRTLDLLDFLIALALLAFVAGLAFLWAYPYPHPSLWSCLSTLRYHVNVDTLALFGRISLGLMTALCYLIIRTIWFQTLDKSDEYGDRFFYSRFGPICGSLLLAFLPAVWHAGQFLSPEFFLMLVEFAAIFIWLMGRGRERYFTYTSAHFILGFVGAANPYAFLLLTCMVAADGIGRWQSGLLHDQRDVESARVKSGYQELVFSISAAAAGFLVGMLAIAYYGLLRDFTWNLPAIFMFWGSTWLAEFGRTLSSPVLVAMFCYIICIVIAMAFGRRIRSVGPSGFPMATGMSCLVGLITLVLVARSYEGDCRVRLSLVGEFVREVIQDAKDVKWLFTEGCFDDILRYELAKSGGEMKVFDMMHPPTPAEERRMRDWAPDFGEREIFSGGGAEVFRAWARERPDRLSHSAWLFGGGILQQFGVTNQRTCGAVLRSEPDTQHEAQYDEADARLDRLQEKFLDVLEHLSPWGRIFGGIDSAVRAKFDGALWRMGRLVTARAERCSLAGDLTKAQELRNRVQKLNAFNTSLYDQSSGLERLMPTANLVLSAHEALEIALKRADFQLAQRYASEIIASNPKDTEANFALGMAALQAKDYFRASQHFERVVKATPEEPAALNNLALAYSQINQLDKARDMAKRAAEINSDSAEIRANLTQIELAIVERDKVKKPERQKMKR